MTTYTESNDIIDVNINSRFWIIIIAIVITTIRVLLKKTKKQKQNKNKTNKQTNKIRKETVLGKDQSNISWKNTLKGGNRGFKIGLCIQAKSFYVSDLCLKGITSLLQFMTFRMTITYTSIMVKKIVHYVHMGK